MKKLTGKSMKNMECIKEKLGGSQKTLAKELGVSSSTISRIFSHYEISPETFNVIYEIFHENGEEIDVFEYSF